MATMVAEPVSVQSLRFTALFGRAWQASASKTHRTRLLSFTIRASQSLDGKNRICKELGLFSLRKKIEDAVFHVESLAPTALEFEEARQIKQEKLIRENKLWDDPAKSNDILAKLADSVKLVDTLKDLAYKAEEAKLITQLADMEAIDYGLVKQAYDASVDVCQFLDQYDMLRLLRGSFDMEGASVIIKAGTKGSYSEIWAKQLLGMYVKWAKRKGYNGRIVEESFSKNDGIKSATIEFEFEYAYGYLSGERGVHRMTDSQDGYILLEAGYAEVDVIPLFLEAVDLQVDDNDLVILSSALHEEQGRTEPAVRVQHIPTGISVQASGERSLFANKMKALNRLKAKLLVISREQGVSSVNSIRRDAIVHRLHRETRRYIFHPCYLVQDVTTGIQLHNITSVLDGNIEPLIEAHINIKQDFCDS